MKPFQCCELIIMQPLAVKDCLLFLTVMTKSDRKLKSGEERKYDIELDIEYI